ncbi:hypothetical protein Vadar_033350 [Vaccinium darrowii]|uniref:Uncharacterized protein n=1 Tax=Vaccinium darrowii TaxID=229202 RepID=A0ACB7Z1V3_9ERIC|nr:hypothetical protein Vadar_033350 [Vaccinium darrowii]
MTVEECSSNGGRGGGGGGYGFSSGGGAGGRYGGDGGGGRGGLGGLGEYAMDWDWVMAHPPLRSRGRGGALGGGRFRAEPEVEESGSEVEESGTDVEVDDESLTREEVEEQEDAADTLIVSAFVERWHPETNSFHFDFGETGPTLDNVEQLLGIPTYGLAVQQEDARDAKTLLRDLLCVSENEAKNALVEAKRGQASEKKRKLTGGKGVAVVVEVKVAMEVEWRDLVSLWFKKFGSTVMKSDEEDGFA